MIKIAAGLAGPHPSPRAAARAAGTTTIGDASELRVKESDRIAAMVAVLRAFGVECEIGGHVLLGAMSWFDYWGYPGDTDGNTFDSLVYVGARF